MYTLLLTACINPDGMPFTKVSDQTMRLQQYLEALRFYLDTTPYPIIFTENSGTDISVHFAEAINSGRLEVLTFAGNEDKSKGKGYGEACIIEYALNHSRKLTHDATVVKITGRLIVENLTAVLTHRFPLQGRQSVVCSFNSDFTFPDSRLMVSTIPFLRHFLADKEQMSDFKDIFFEHVLARHILQGRTSYAPFWTEPFIIGISGSSGQSYQKPEASRSRTIAYRLMALHRYRLFEQKTARHHLFKDAVYAILHLWYTLMQRAAILPIIFGQIYKNILRISHISEKKH